MCIYKYVYVCMCIENKIIYSSTTHNPVDIRRALRIPLVVDDAAVALHAASGAGMVAPTALGASSRKRHDNYPPLCCAYFSRPCVNFLGKRGEGGRGGAGSRLRGRASKHQTMNP